jgi:hypothetical protein
MALYNFNYRRCKGFRVRKCTVQNTKEKILSYYVVENELLEMEFRVNREVQIDMEIVSKVHSI